MVSSFSNPKSLSAYDRCKWCNGSGCLMCPGERRKHKSAEAKQQAERIAQLQSMTVDQIFAELNDIRTKIRIASGIQGITLTEQSIEEMARIIVLENLAKGGHEFPVPNPVFTSDGSPEQTAEMVEVFQFDRLQDAIAPGGEGIKAILTKAQEVMARRTSA